MLSTHNYPHVTRQDQCSIQQNNICLDQCPSSPSPPSPNTQSEDAFETNDLLAGEIINPPCLSSIELGWSSASEHISPQNISSHETTESESSYATSGSPVSPAQLGSSASRSSSTSDTPPPFIDGTKTAPTFFSASGSPSAIYKCAQCGRLFPKDYLRR
jgi:hypothetical protein